MLKQKKYFYHSNFIFLKALFCGIFFSFSISSYADNLKPCRKLKLQLRPSTYHFDSNSAAFLNLIVEAPANPSTARCSFFIGFGYGNASRPELRRLRGPKSTLPIQFWKDASRNQILKDLPEATSSQDVIAGTLDLAQSKMATFSYMIELQTLELPFFGEYHDHFSISLYVGSISGSSILVDSNILNLHFHQPRVAEVSLVESGAPFDKNDQSQIFNYGELQQGKTLSCDLVAKYNAGMRLSFHSTNKGHLRIRKRRPYLIPYTMKVNSRPLFWPPSGHVIVDTQYGKSPASGQRYTLDATIGALGSAPTGDYSDEILIRIESIR